MYDHSGDTRTQVMLLFTAALLGLTALSLALPESPRRRDDKPDWSAEDSVDDVAVELGVLGEMVGERGAAEGCEVVASRLDWTEEVGNDSVRHHWGTGFQCEVALVPVIERSLFSSTAWAAAPIHWATNKSPYVVVAVGCIMTSRDLSVVENRDAAKTKRTVHEDWEITA